MSVYYADDQVTVHHGDALDVLAGMPDASVDAVVTDPPYGLEFMGREWDSFGRRQNHPLDPNMTMTKDSSAEARAADNPWQKEASGYGAPRKNARCLRCNRLKFSQNSCQCESPDWDTRTREYAQAYEDWCFQWAVQVRRLLKPGGHLLAFGGTRTFHRLACAIEDAGFEIRDNVLDLLGADQPVRQFMESLNDEQRAAFVRCVEDSQFGGLLAWVYGSGFPKSLDVSKAIDKRPGVERHPEFAADLRAAMAAKGYTNTFDVAEAVIGRRTGAVANWQKYQWPEAKWWPKLRDLLGMDEDKWGPVIAEAERQRTGMHAAGLRTGNAGIGGGGEGKERRDAPATDDARRWQGWGTALKPAWEPVIVARKPLAGTVAGNVLAHRAGALNIDGCRVGGDNGRPARQKVKSDQSASTFFGQSKGKSGKTATTDDEPCEVHGVRRCTICIPRLGGRWPANVVLDEDAAAQLDRQSGTLTSGRLDRAGITAENGIYGAAPKVRSGLYEADSGGASRFYYTAKAAPDERPRVNGVSHPTVKPLDLMRWLVRLVTPPGGLVLDPFAGSGTTGEACVIEGFRAVLIEREADYLPLIEARLSKPIQPTLGGAP